MGKRKVLIVDDEPDIVRLVQFTLERRGFEVIVATDGLSAIELAETEKPDVILLDAVMPVMNGYTACQRLKENSKTKSIPVIMLSAKSQKVEVELGIEMGAENYICKPFSPSQIADLVCEICEFKKEEV